MAIVRRSVALFVAFLLGHGTALAVTLTSPNGGESWLLGSRQEITWRGTGNSWRLALFRGETRVGVIASQVAGNTFAWEAGKLLSGSVEPGRNYRVRVVSVTDQSVADTSDAPFALNAFSSAVQGMNAQSPPPAGVKPPVQAGDARKEPSAADLKKTPTPSDWGARYLKVTAPNGGETYFVGRALTVKWESSGLTGDVKIWLTDNRGGWPVKSISPVMGARNVGSFSWVVPEDVPPGEYRINVALFQDDKYRDMSDRSFAIKLPLEEARPGIAGIRPAIGREPLSPEDLAKFVKVNVTKPAEGSRTTFGREVEVRWERPDPLRNYQSVKLELFYHTGAGGPVGPLDSRGVLKENSGVYFFNVVTNLHRPGRFFVGLQTPDGKYSGRSGVFEIVDPAALPTTEKTRRVGVEALKYQQEKASSFAGVILRDLDSAGTGEQEGAPLNKVGSLVSGRATYNIYRLLLTFPELPADFRNAQLKFRIVGGEGNFPIEFVKRRNGDREFATESGPVIKTMYSSNVGWHEIELGSVLSEWAKHPESRHGLLIKMKGDELRTTQTRLVKFTDFSLVTVEPDYLGVR